MDLQHSASSQTVLSNPTNHLKIAVHLCQLAVIEGRGSTVFSSLPDTCTI